MITIKTDKLIESEELFTSFNEEVERIRKEVAELEKAKASLLSQLEDINKRGLLLTGKLDQAEKDLDRVTSVVTTANEAWDQQLKEQDKMTRKRLNDERVTYYRKGHNAALESINDPNRKRRPRSVSEAIAAARVKKMLGEEKKNAKN